MSIKSKEKLSKNSAGMYIFISVLSLCLIPVLLITGVGVFRHTNIDGENLEPVTLLKFNGQTLNKFEFDENSSFYVYDSGYSVLNSLVTNLNLGSEVKSTSNGLEFNLVDGDNSFYARFLTAESSADTKNIKVSDYEYFTVDFDISNVKVGFFKLYLLFRDASGKSYGGNDSYFTLSDEYIDLGKRCNAKDARHVTLVYSFKSTDEFVVNAYVDGEYCSSRTVALNGLSTFSIEGLCIGDSAVSPLGYSFSINNVEYNVFEKGYSGAIGNVFKYPLTSLRFNTDSIFYWKKN